MWDFLPRKAATSAVTAALQQFEAGQALGVAAHAGIDPLRHGAALQVAQGVELVGGQFFVLHCRFRHSMVGAHGNRSAAVRQGAPDDQCSCASASQTMASATGTANPRPSMAWTLREAHGELRPSWILLCSELPMTLSLARL